MPDHCFTSTVNNAGESLQEWEVNWQPNVKNIMNYSEAQFDTSAETDEILCDL